jgi:hypothetical protein
MRSVSERPHPSLVVIGVVLVLAAVAALAVAVSRPSARGEQTAVGPAHHALARASDDPDA